MRIDNYRIIVGNATDVGRVRQYNEDYMAHFATSYGYCIVVCDGMGGHAAGDVASQAAIEALKHYLQDGKVTKLDTANSLYNAIEFANYKLREMVLNNPALSGMGTTCVIALINNSQMYVAHAGDSRLYLLRDHNIKQISKDHSTVQQLIDAGVLSEDEAQLSDKRNQITKAIGIFEKVEPSVTREPIHLRQNDKILLCSDGLTSHASSKDILEIVKAIPDVQDAAMKLIEKANQEGGTDNITVQLVEYTGKSSHVKKHKRLRRFTRVVAIILFFSAIGYFAYLKYIQYTKIKEQKEEISGQKVIDTAQHSKKEKKKDKIEKKGNSGSAKESINKTNRVEPKNTGEAKIEPANKKTIPVNTETPAKKPDPAGIMSPKVSQDESSAVKST